MRVRRLVLLSVSLLLVLAGCSSQPALQGTPEKPESFTNQTMVDYATESERVTMYNGIISREGDVEGDLTVNCDGRPLYQTEERAVVTVGCRASPYVSNGGHAETWPHFYLYVFEGREVRTIRPSESGVVTLNESAHESVWLTNTGTTNRTVTIELRSQNASNATVLDAEPFAANEGLWLGGLHDRATNWLWVEVGNRSVRLDAWQDYFDTLTTVYIAPDGTLHTARFEYPLSDDQ